MVSVPAFSELGSKAKGVLVGQKTGAYQLNNVVTVSSTTQDGLNLALTVAKKDGALDMAVRSTYATGNLKLVTTVSQAGKLSLAATLKDLAPGLTLGASTTAPDDLGKVNCPITGLPLTAAKLTADYSRDSLTVKSALAVGPSPKLDVAVTTGVDKITVGADVSVDAKATLAKWNVGAGYTAADFQAAVFLNDASVVTGRLAHSVSGTATIGAEVAHSLPDKSTTFSAGLSKTLEKGALLKARLDNNGQVSVLYEQALQSKSKMGLTAQFDALALDKAPRFGWAYDLTY